MVTALLCGCCKGVQGEHCCWLRCGEMSCVAACHATERWEIAASIVLGSPALAASDHGKHPVPQTPIWRRRWDGEGQIWHRRQPHSRHRSGWRLFRAATAWRRGDQGWSRRPHRTCKGISRSRTAMVRSNLAMLHMSWLHTAESSSPQTVDRTLDRPSRGAQSPGCTYLWIANSLNNSTEKGGTLSDRHGLARSGDTGVITGRSRE